MKSLSEELEGEGSEGARRDDCGGLAYSEMEAPFTDTRNTGRGRGGWGGGPSVWKWDEGIRTELCGNPPKESLRH